MTETIFRQPPLVEIIAELHWDIPGLQGVPEQLAAAPLPVPNPSAYEIDFMNFASKAGAKGFGLVERVIPPGFPLLAHQVAFRYRNTTGVQGSPLFQLGPGVFSINLVPPYQSWQSFVPFITHGLELLLDSRSTEDKSKPFAEARLRYIDAFGDSLSQGRPILSFLSDGLGIKIQLPQAIMQFCANADQVKPSFSISMPISVGRFDMKVAEGWVRNARSLLMDTTVTCHGPLEPRSDTVLAAFNNAHRVIHDSFVGMTKSLHPLMQPETQV
jgi:uncharacterized protein (TIGR04255 family)